MADRLQRKRVQNREAQQKYRSRVRERMSAMEKEIQQLKSATNAADPERQLARASAASKPDIEHSCGASCGAHEHASRNNAASSPRSPLSPSINDADYTDPTTTSQRAINIAGGLSQDQRWKDGMNDRRRATDGDIEMPLQSTRSRPSTLPSLSPEVPHYSWLSTPTSQIQLQDCWDDFSIPFSGEGCKVSQSSLENLIALPSSCVTQGLSNIFEHSISTINQTTDFGLAPGSSNQNCTARSHVLLPEMAEKTLGSDTFAPFANTTHNAHGNTEERLEEQSLEERFENVRLCLSTAGFSSLDSALSQFYTSAFSYDSNTSSQQRASRQRHLPLLLADLRESVRDWTQWEAHGYCEEIIKSTESILTSEKQDAGIELPAKSTNPLAELASACPSTYGGNDNCLSLSALQSLMRLFQERTPKLFAMVEALTNSADISDRKERFHITIVLMLLLNRPEGLSERHRMNVMKKCLDMAYSN